MRFPISMALLILGSATAGWGQTTATPPAGYEDPGPPPMDVLPSIIADLKRTMKDPYSIRDFALCEPEVTKPFKYPIGPNWARAHWSVKFVLNAKNSYGGYAGLSYFTADFKDGKLEGVSSPNLGPALNRKLVELASGCPRVPDEEIQRLLAA